MRSKETQRQNSKNIKSSAKRITDDKTQQIDSERCSRCGRNNADKDYRWNIGDCFKYGQMDHKIANYPLNIKNQFGQWTYDGQNKGGRQISKIQGRVYAFTQQNAQASNAVVTRKKNFKDKIFFSGERM